MYIKVFIIKACKQLFLLVLSLCLSHISLGGEGVMLSNEMLSKVWGFGKRYKGGMAVGGLTIE